MLSESIKMMISTRIVLTLKEKVKVLRIHENGRSERNLVAQFKKTSKQYVKIEKILLK